VSGFEQEFPGRVTAQNVDATTPESKVVVEELGWGNHGLVIRSPGGESLWNQPDHEVNVDDARAKLKELLSSDEAT
jgi:aspartate/tyrosine/aromatic aminotransferase